MIAIIDYGLGNIKAFYNIYKSFGIPVSFAKTAEDLEKATKIILPGVGAFDQAMENLNNSGLREKLDELVLEKKIPVLGICVGMQMLANSSEEGKLKGLNWIKGKVKRFIPQNYITDERLLLPHMGWNDVSLKNNSELFEGLENPRFYFLHSFYFHCNDPENRIASTNYSFEFDCAVNEKNIYGVQFHPEKSHHFGVRLLKNFATNI